MDKMDKHIASRIASSPTIAALVSALGIQGIFGRSLATFGGGLIGGSLVGGVFAGGRATRESRDEIQSALRSHAYNGTQQAHNVHQGAINKIISIIDGRNIEDFVRAFRNSSLSITDKATLAREYYARREATRDTGYNFLLYPNDKAAMLNVEILEDLKTLGLDKAWRTSPDTQESMANLVTLYHEKAKQALDYDLAHRKSYALKQGAIFGGSAFAVGGALGALQYGIHSGYSAIMNMPINTATMPPSNTISSNTLAHGVARQAVTGHQILSTIDRNWLQNGTPAPIFDGNELGIHQTHNGNIEVSSLSHEVSTQGGLQDLFKIGSRDYYAIVTMPDGVHYKIDINSDGVLVPDDNMKTILSDKSFSTLEIAHLRSDGGHNIFATLSGDKSGLYAPGSSVEAPPLPWALPIGGNRYHESRDRDGFLRDSDPDLGQLLKEEMVKKIPRDSQSSHKTEARSEHEPSKLSSPSTPLLTHIPHNTMKTIHTNKSQDEISDLETSARSYWDEIVKLRTMLESRKNGTIALSDADIANMEATEKIMLQHYSEKQKMIASLKGSPSSLKEPIESTQKKVGQVLQKPIQKTSGAQEGLTDRLSASIPSIEKELNSIEATLKTFLAKQRLKDRAQFFDSIEILKDRKNTVSASLKNDPGNTNIQGDLMQIETGLKAYEEIRELFEKKRVLMQRYRDTLMQKTIYTEFLEKHEIGSWEKAITKLKKLERKKAKIDALPKEANSKAKGAKKLDAFKQAISLHERIQTINSWIKDYDTQTKKVSAPDTSLSTPSDKGGAGHTEAQTDNSSLLRIEYIPQESQKLEEKITENYNFYKRTGDRLYLRFNEEILKDIARIEKKSLAKYQIQEGKVFRV